MKSICVFCGASSTPSPQINAAVAQLGQLLASRNIKLVYGGGSIGLMGQIADSVLESGGQAVGVIPKFLNHKEVAHSRLTELIEVENMHERKLKMFELADGFIALPGGFGTLEEIMEVITWRQLGLHSKPIAFLNINGFYDSLSALFDRMEEAQLLSQSSRSSISFSRSIADLQKLLGLS